MVAVLSDDRAYRTAMKAGRVMVRDWRAAHAGRVHGISFRPRRASEPSGIGRITVERQRFSQARAAAAPAAPIMLSLLAHAACLLAFVLLLPSRMALPDIPGTTQVAMVFEPVSAAAPPAVSAVPTAASATVPTPPEPTLAATPTNAPPPPQVAQPSATQVPVPPAPAAPVRPPTTLAPVPAPPPVRTAAEPLPAPPVHLARAVPKAAAPPTRTPPAEPQVALRPHSEPAGKFASLTPPSAAPAEVPSTDVAASRPTATGPLIPPRPVAGMATNRAPAYPETALRRGEQGRVMLRVSVSTDGRPLEVEVAQTSGYPSLDAAALSAVRQWRFVPAMQAGTAVAAMAEVPVRFRIDN